MKIKHCNAQKYEKVESVLRYNSCFRLNTSQQPCRIQFEYVWMNRNSSVNIFLARPSWDTFCLLCINFCSYAAAFYIEGIIFKSLKYFKSSALGKGINKVQRPVCFPHSRLLKSLCQPVQSAIVSYFSLKWWITQLPRLLLLHILILELYCWGNLLLFTEQPVWAEI